MASNAPLVSHNVTSCLTIWPQQCISEKKQYKRVPFINVYLFLHCKTCSLTGSSGSVNGLWPLPFSYIGFALCISEQGGRTHWVCWRIQACFLLLLGTTNSIMPKIFTQQLRHTFSNCLPTFWKLVQATDGHQREPLGMLALRCKQVRLCRA